MSSDESRKEAVVADIRACLVSSGVGLSLYNLEKDYRNLIGERIPYRDFGYPGLVDFLKSIGQFKISFRNGDVHVEAVASQESKHIADLVKGQKRSRPKNRGHRSFFPRHRKTYFARPVIPSSISFKPIRPYQSQKEPQNNSSHGSKWNSPSNMPKHTFAGSKPDTGKGPNHSIVGDKPASYSQATQPNHLNGSKQNVTLHQQETLAWVKPHGSGRGCYVPQMPNLSLVENKPASYGQAIQSNHPSGSKPNITSHQQEIITWVKPRGRGCYVPQMPNLSLVENKPASYGQAIQSNHPSGSKPNITSHQQEIITRVKPRGRGCYVPQMPQQMDNAGVMPSMLPSREVGPNIAQSKPAEAPSQLSKPSVGHLMLNSGLLNVQSQNQSTESTPTMPTLNENSIRRIAISPIQSRLDRVRQPSGNQKLPIPHDILHKRQSDNNAMKTKFLPQLKKPDLESHWELFVLNFIDFSKISVRLIGPDYSDKFALLEEKMTFRYIGNHTTAHQVIPSELIVGSSYAFVDLNNKFVSRVLLQRYFKNENEVSVVFFDLAEEATVPIDMIYELDDEFTTLAPQSFEVFLEGLEPYNFEEFNGVDFGTNSYCGNSYVAIVSRPEDPCSITVTLYDTSSDDAALDVNDTLRKKVACKLQSSFIDKKMLRDNDCIEAFITNIDEDGNVFINIICKSFGCLLERLTEIDRNKNLEIQKVTSIDEISTLRYYFVSGETPLRAVINKINSDNSVIMEFVDCGQFREVQINQLFYVPKFDRVLKDIPHQATMVRLAGVDYSWAPLHQSLFIEIVEIFSKAVVEIKYVRNDYLYVNITINKDGKRLNVGDAMNIMHRDKTNTIMHGMLEVRGKSVYKQWPVSKNIYKEVLVPSYESAENISLQLVDRIQDLRDLMNQLKSHYSVNKPTRPFKDWRVGDPCVVSYSECENYFRGVILQFDSCEFARIRCVDFGYTTIVPIDSVFILDDTFKVTPTLALNAKLAGIEPICGVKKLEATKLMNSYFKEQKKFWAKVVDVNNLDSLFPTYSVVLCDTSQEVDINFSDLLVEEGLAIKAASS